MAGDPRPPSGARRLLAALVPRPERTWVLDDLAEEFARLCRERGAREARGWYRRQVARSVMPALALRIRRAAFFRKGDGLRDTTDGGRTPLLEDSIADVRYALRGLRRNPGFTAVALLTLALGIGANTAVFSIVNGILLRPLPYPAPEELVLLYSSSPRSGEMLGRVSFQDFEDWQARSRALASMAAFAPVPTILTGEGDPLEVELTYVTPAFFDILGVRPELGRALLPDDHDLAQRNAVIAHELWRTALAADPNVVGRSILLRGVPYTVVGVMPPSLRHPTPATDVWVPQSLVEPNMFANGMPARGDRYLQAFARRAPAAEVVQVQREISALAGELATTYPESNEDWTAATVVPLHESIVGDVDRALVIVLGVVGFILLIGCANLANLLLARGSARQRELAVRATLGAGRGRVVRQLMTESLVLALIGGVLGLALSYQGVRSILALSADTLPRVQDVHVDARVVGFALLLTAATGILFGLVPALRLAHGDPQEDLRGGPGSAGHEGRRLRSALVVAEIALAVLLVVGAGLMGRSFLALRSVDAGFEPERVLTATMQLNLTGVPDADVATFLVQRREEILRRVRELPGVESAGMINVFPLHDGAFTVEYRRAEGIADTGEPGVHADTRYVDPGYLETMGIPLVRGEPLPVRLAAGEPVPVLLSESAARRLWPDANPVGRRITVPWGESIVVGIVGDVRQLGLAVEAQPAVYFPQLIAPRLMATLVVRTAGDPRALGGPVRGVIQEIDPNQPIRSILPLEDVMAESIAQERFFTVLFAVFGGLALTLAGVGVYGVLAYAVRQRTQEIGVRMALGAGTGEVLRMIAAGGMRVVGAGLAIGAVAALALGRVLASQLYGVEPTDPVSFAFAIAFLGAVALLAIYVPARRAMRVPPMTALRP